MAFLRDKAMDLKKSVKRIIKKVSNSRENQTLLPVATEPFPPGHYYSVIPSLADVRNASKNLFQKNICAIDFQTENQIKMLKKFYSMNEHPPFYVQEKRNRFNIENDSFSYDDAPILHYMMRHLRPKRVIEIGSGNSSACMLDTSEMYLDNSVDFTFIDINLENLRKNLLQKDLNRIEALELPIQSVDPAIFAALQANDILFIDSSHVIKIGSDLNTIFFEILPNLSPGVCIHFHDIRFPFQYQENMIMSGIYWNEAYLLQAFLMYNEAFEISFWLNYLNNVNLPGVTDLLRFLPLAEWDRRFNNSSKDYSGAGESIYITKIQ